MKLYGQILYYGCWSTTGHHLYNERGESFYFPSHPLHQSLDTGLLAGVDDNEQNLGRVHVTRFGVRYTILSFWDRSIDKRPGSNSNFVFEGAIPAQEAMAIARQKFPAIFERAKFPIALEHVDMFTVVEANTSGTI